MRTLDLSLLVIVLAPAWAYAQEPAPGASSESPAAAEVSPPEAPPEAPPPEAPPPAPQPAPAAPPAPPAPTYAQPAPPQAPAAPPPPQAPAGYGYAPPAYRAPPAAAFTPQPSPLLVPSTGYSHPPAYYPPPAPVAPPAQPYYYPPPQYPSTYTLPPLPPGYVYMPTPTAGGQAQPGPTTDAVRRQELYEELRRADLRLDELERQRIGIGGPIVMMVVGYGSAAISGLVSLAAYNAKDRIRQGNYDAYYDQAELDINNDGVIDKYDARRFQKMGRIGLGVGAAALFVGITATARLVKRKGQRQERDEQITAVTADRDRLRRQLDIGPAVGGGQYGVQLQGRY